MRRALSLLIVAGCAVPPSPERAKAWPVETFFLARDKDFSGFNTSRLALLDGEENPWVPGERAVGKQLVLQPAYADGAPAAYVITEIWDAHPDLWVQPVYHFVKRFDALDPTAHPTGADGVFGVGIDSTFYSPFWRLWWLEPGTELGPYTNVAQITKFPRHRGPMVVCPIVPDGVLPTGMTAPGVRPSGILHPFTGELLSEIGIGLAYVNGTRVEYFGLGANRQVVTAYEGDADGVVEAADLYVFARIAADGARTLLDVPAVLPAEAQLHAYVRRVDVVLDTQAVFVPESRPDLKAKLTGLVSVPFADPAIPDVVEQQYLLRVAKDGACFASAAGFPSSCEWLDSEQAIEHGVAANRLFETAVTLTATRVLPQ